MTGWTRFTPYRAADIIVLTSPLYYWSLSEQLRTAFDRLFAMAEYDLDYANQRKECAILMVAEGDKFYEAIYYYDNLVRHPGLIDRGRVLCGGVMAGDIEVTKTSMRQEPSWHRCDTMSKALLINGRSKAKSCTYTAPKIATTLEKEGVESKIYHVKNDVSDCRNYEYCAKKGRYLIRTRLTS